MNPAEPPPEPAPPAPRAPSPLESVRDIWKAGEKLVRGYKLYGLGHANTRVFVTDLHGKLSVWFGSRGALEVVLTPTDVLVDGEKVLRGEGQEHNWAQPLAVSGVVRLRLEPGLDHAELERLFSLLLPKAVGAGDELTTRLWTESFAHVRWKLDSELDRADPRDEATANWLKAALQLVQAGKAETVERTPKRPPNLAELARDGLAELAAVPGPPWDKLQLSRESYGAVCAESKADADAAIRALGYLIEAGRAPTDAELELAGGLLVPALGKLASSGDVAQAERLLGLLDGGPLDEAARARVLEPAAAGLARTCVTAVKEGRAAPAAAGNVLRRLGPPAAVALVEGVGSMQAGPDRVALAALLPMFGDPALSALIQALPKLPADAALELLAPVVALKGPLTVDVWDTACGHPAPAVVKEATRRAADPGQMSPGRAAATLTSADPKKRLAAIGFLRKSREPSAAPALDAVIDGDSFKGFGAEEKKELLGALADLDAGLALSAARRLFGQKALLGGAALEETRIAAALALGRLGDVDSRAGLQEVAGGRAGALKDACVQAVRQIDLARRKKGG